ncbi:polysaccharide biosynthesis protein [Rhodococcus sp. 06-156-3C]|nr:polysaccharide biosynthesis protein [Rhodococcus sp. 06-156-4C]OZD20317.1 polysaccharide biosynthesis protein [Rhodococcus sp. 06-156-3C]OZD21551.1 polysaccharide biosynthesis protein [Rhodococcus sp. 06-156-4a]OZD33245.1 polysaccharide biosynthesis protein [Rhodococcus sp. 06-156-3b]OZD40020.1 polysaccharide biosynthesis protein [Rhodococcus sp. 06-156-3]OZF66533.1 polysaccharide biosynthesis protein [Rhodococcus sp. 06-156-4]
MTIGSMTANIASYLLHLPASRLLGVAKYGEFASLLAAQLVLAVPALALQSVVAREVVRGRSTGKLRSLGYRCAGVVAVLSVLAAPIVAVAMDTSVLATTSALVVAPLLVLLATEQGLLQGTARFGRLSIVLASAGFGKVVPAVVALFLGAGPGTVLAVSAAGTGLVALGARLANREPPGPDGPHTGDVRIGVATVLRASQVQLVLILLSSVDLLLARALLTEADAGIYALGAVATKAAFWLPQAVGVVLYPRMANPAHSASALRSALSVVAGIGAVLILGAAVAAGLIPLIVGEDYAAVQGYLWIFALQGACLAVLQSALLWAIAGERTTLAILAWLGLAAEVALLTLCASTVLQFVVVAVSVAATTALAVCVAALRS